ncbi:MAG: TIGR02206 family membrane protein [Bryobacteraceae bacterium]|nr:TIGR02206 family membrane protein [Bryobacteraceae bacterium]
MQPDFVLFGARHWGVILAIPAAAALLRLAAGPQARRGRAVRLAAGVFLAVNELVWYAYRLYTEGVRFPEALPLNLCDLSLWLTVCTLLTLNRWLFDATWFIGIGGASMAVLTPELWAPFWSYPTMYFFTAHGGVIATLLFLAWSGMARPRPRAILRAMLVLHAWAAFVAAFNLVFHTNYMYLCEKPSTPSLLDYMGPWPWYIVSGELVAWAVFGVLALPFRRGKDVKQ